MAILSMPRGARVLVRPALFEFCNSLEAVVPGKEILPPVRCRGLRETLLNAIKSLLCPD